MSNPQPSSAGAKTAGRAWRVAVALAATVLTSACSGPEPRTGLGDLNPLDQGLTLRELRSPAIHTSASAATPSLFRQYRIVAQRLVLPRSSPQVSLAMEMLQEPNIDRQTLELWHRNGLGIGRIPRQRLALLRANLPRIIDSTVTRIQYPNRYVPLPLIDRGGNVRHIRYLKDESRQQQLRLYGGEYRLLAKLLSPFNESETPQLDLLPHHHSPVASIFPQSGDERMLSGTAFHALRLTAPIETNNTWLVWATDLPQLDEPPSKEATDHIPPQLTDPLLSEIDWADTGRTSEPSRPRPSPPMPVSVAEAMLTGQYGDEPVQIVLVIAVERVRAAHEPAESPDEDAAAQ